MTNSPTYQEKTSDSGCDMLFRNFKALSLSLLLSRAALADSTCMYVENGMWKSVASIREVPRALRNEAKCSESAPKEEATGRVQGLAAPSDIQLEGDERRVTVPSSLGRIELRWARSSEKLFGRTPERALQDAVTTVSRTLRKGGFPTNLFQNTTNWQVVVMDENVPAAQIPKKLVTDCHPAWMTGPANIYVVAQRVATGCSGKKSGTREADTELAKVLLHEMGHVVEYHLMNGHQSHDPFRAEGFATWFAQYSSEFSDIIKRGELKEENKKAGALALSRGGDLRAFDGSFFDYAKASLLFTALADRKGVGGVMDLYREIGAEGDLFQAIEKRHYWNSTRVVKEIERLVK